MMRNLTLNYMCATSGTHLSIALNVFIYMYNTYEAPAITVSLLTDQMSAKNVVH